MADGRYVVVCTDKRGVFAGILEQQEDGKAVLSDARMCVYWSEDVRGVVGLAATGPTGRCRITRAAPRVELSGVTAVMDCTDGAREAWEAGPWS